MVSGKKRLYIALYPSGVVNNEERKYHWGFLVGPKDESKTPVPGMRYHVKNIPSPKYPLTGKWIYEKTSLSDVTNTITLLGRILVAKIEDEHGLVDIFETNRIVQGDSNWRCRTWMAEVLSRLAGDKVVGTSQLDWTIIESTAREYIGGKASVGRYQSRSVGPRPTYDLIQGREINP